MIIAQQPIINNVMLDTNKRMPKAVSTMGPTFLISFSLFFIVLSSQPRGIATSLAYIFKLQLVGERIVYILAIFMDILSKYQVGIFIAEILQVRMVSEFQGFGNANKRI